MKTSQRKIVLSWVSGVCLALMSALGSAADQAAPDTATTMKLATQYAQSHKLNWGKAESAIYNGVQTDPQARRPEVDGTSWVFFKTPKAEEDLLWKRVLVVKPDGSILNLRDTNGKAELFSPKKAKQLAAEYARAQKMNWGKVEREVERPDADTYWVYFQTPAEEEQALSKRVLVVKRDGTVSAPPMRR